MRLTFWLTLTILVSLSITASAVELTSIDIGTAALLPGETITEDGEYTISAGGHDIWGNADGFRFVYLELSGDFESSVQIPFFNRGVDPWAKAGIMARDTLNADSANFISTADESAGYGAQDSWRLVKGGKKHQEVLFAFNWAYDNLSKLSREYLKFLPEEIRLEIANKRILLTHGKPEN